MPEEIIEFVEDMSDEIGSVGDLFEGFGGGFVGIPDVPSFNEDFEVSVETVPGDYYDDYDDDYYYEY